MNSVLDRFRIPTLLGLAIIVIGTAAGVYLVIQNQSRALTTQASVDNTPRNIQTSGITDTSATLTWQTASKIASFLTYGVGNPDQTTLDDRDTSQPSPRMTHIVTLTNLTPETIYSYKLVAGKYSAVGQFKTAAASTAQNNLNPVIGSVLEGTGPLLDGLVFLTIPGAQTQVVAIQSLGNFIIPLAAIRKADLSDIFVPTNAVGTITVQAEDGGAASAIFNIGSANPIGPLKIGQDLDFTKKPAQLGVSTSKFDLNGDGKVNSADYVIVKANLNKKNFDKKADLNSDGKVDQKDLNLISSEINRNSK